MFYRLFTLVKKELLTMLQDRQTRLILILPVLFQVLLFPFAATLELTNAPLAIYNEDNGPIANELIQRFSMAKTFSSVRLLRYPQQIKQVIDNQKVLVVIHFPTNFSRHILMKQPTTLQVLLDGRNSNSAQIAANYVQDIVRHYQLSLASSNATPLPQTMVIRNFYNPNLDYKWFMLPSLIAMITTTGVLTVTALSITREREQGTLDQLFVAPLTTWQIFIGKAIPASLVAMFQSTVVLLIGIFGYRIAFAGSLLLFYFSMAIYSLSLIGTGLLIASFSSTQQQAFIGVFAFIMPTILLSGSVAPIENMPKWLQYLTFANPIRHFTDIAKELYLKDANLATIAHSLWPLLLIAVITSYLAYQSFRKKI